MSVALRAIEAGFLTAELDDWLEAEANGREEDDAMGTVGSSGDPARARGRGLSLLVAPALVEPDVSARAAARAIEAGALDEEIRAWAGSPPDTGAEDLAARAVLARLVDLFGELRLTREVTAAVGGAYARMIWADPATSACVYHFERSLRRIAARFDS